MSILPAMGAISGMAAEGSTAAIGAAQATLQMSLAGAVANTMKTAGQTIQGGTGH
jgi:hypothetical protein